MKFIETQNILYTKQFGFRQNYSTTQALLSITNKKQKAVDDGIYSCGIFLDFSKAFDTVNHNILIMKLDHYGFGGIVKKWFCSYLNERKQYVSIGNAISTINKSLVEFHKDQYLDHFFSYSILMISIILPINLIFIYLLMTLIFSMLTRVYQN